MAICKQFKICGLMDEADPQHNLCILHSADPHKDRDAFRIALRNMEETRKGIFREIIFPEEIIFADHIFNEYADFSGARFSKGADFSQTTFSDSADFGGAAFSEGADFSGTRFSKGASFYHATFSKGARLCPGLSQRDGGASL